MTYILQSFDSINGSIFNVLNHLARLQNNILGDRPLNPNS